MARSKPTDATAPSGKAGRGPKDGGRGRSSNAATPGGSTAAPGKGKGKEPKLGKDGQPKVSRLKKIGGQVRMIKQAYSLTRTNDPKLPWIMLIWFVAVAAVMELVGTARSRASPARPHGCSRACAATGGSPPASPARSRWTPSTGCWAARA
jgi:hypothetical protein